MKELSFDVSQFPFNEIKVCLCVCVCFRFPLSSSGLFYLKDKPLGCILLIHRSDPPIDRSDPSDPSDPSVGNTVTRGLNLVTGGQKK